MAGWVGDGLGEAGAVAACKGGAFTAAGPVSDVCASVVVACVEDDAGVGYLIGTDGSDCPESRYCPNLSYCQSHHSFDQGSME